MIANPVIVLVIMNPPPRAAAKAIAQTDRRRKVVVSRDGGRCDGSGLREHQTPWGRRMEFAGSAKKCSGTLGCMSDERRKRGRLAAAKVGGNQGSRRHEPALKEESGEIPEDAGQPNRMEGEDLVDAISPFIQHRLACRFRIIL